MRLWKRLQMWSRRRQYERDLEEEVRIHREMSGAAAFGSVATTLEESRAVWGFAWLDSWKQDIRYSARGLWRSPGFALAVIGAIGLGLGLNTTMFTVFNSYVLRPLAVRDPYGLYGFTWYGKNGQGHFFTWDQYTSLRSARSPYSDVLASRDLQAQVEGRAMFGQLVSPNYFTMLGVGVAQGRPLLPDDRGAVMVLSYESWQNEFGGDAGIIGRKVYLRGRPFEVVGVASREFVGLGTYPGGFWIPLAMSAAVMDGPDVFAAHQPDVLKLVGRLQPGMSPQAAQSALLAFSQTISPDAIGVAMLPHATSVPLTRDAILTFIPLFVAFLLVLVIACANVSNLMLARALARQREVAIRVSLGASRARLIRQLLTESLMLAAPASAAGYLISQITIEGGRRLLLATVPPTFGRFLKIESLALDWRVFGFILGAAVLAALLFGLAPAIQTTRSRVVETNRGDFSSDYRPARLRNLLVVVQVGVCSLLLICTGVVVRSERRVLERQTGMDLRHVWDVRMMERQQAAAAARLEADPAVEAVSVAWHAPLYGSPRVLGVTPSGRKDAVRTGYNFVSPGYFSVFRIGTVRGRLFTAEESETDTPVAVVSESAARVLWPGRDAVGETITLSPPAGHDVYFDRRPTYGQARVIGVVRDVVSGMLGNAEQLMCVYLPTHARAPHNDSIQVRLRSETNARRRLDAMLDEVAPSLSDMVNPMDDVLAVQIYPFRLMSWLSGFLGGVGLLLTISGIYGVMSYLVSQRTKEIGLRVALGADAWGVVRMVVRQSAWLAGIGALAGIGLALMVAPVFVNQLDAIRPYEWVPYASTTFVVLLAAVLASYRPARRAVAIDPVQTLRCE